MVPAPVLPQDLDGCHALALPAGADVRALAAAWFAEVAWEVFPLAPTALWDTATQFRAAGAAMPAGDARQGRLRLVAGTTLTGPWSLPAHRAADGLPARDLDLYALAPGVSDPLILGWLGAAARRAGGAVISADRTQVLAPDPSTAVDLTLWTGTALTAPELVARVRPFLAGARVGEPSALPGGQPGGPAPYSVTARFEFDGAVDVSAQPRDAVPVAVVSQAWGAAGPWTYRFSWAPPDPAELSAPQPSRLHVIARNRVAPVIARVARALQQTAGGVVVDDGGFPVGDDELAARSVTL